MRSLRIPLIAATLLCCSAATATRLRGVMSELKHHYEGLDAAGAVFKCINGKGTATIPAAYVNDNFCDCDDGSDEPGTAACTYLGDRFPSQFKFECLNEGYSRQSFFHSRVNDGICDCCDGSDEFLPPSQGGVACPNTCAQAHQKAEEERVARERTRQAGLTAKAGLIAEATRLQTDVRTKLAEHEATLASIDAEISAAEAEKAKWEAEEQKERDAIHQKSLAEKEKWDAEQAEKKAAAEAAEAANKVAEAPTSAEETRHSEAQGSTPPNVMCTKWRQTGECKGNGPRIPDNDKECDVVVDGDASGFCECVDMRTGLDVEYPFDCIHRKFTCQKMCEAEGKEAGFLSDSYAPPPPAPTFTVDTGAGHSKQEANDARNKLNTLTARREDARRGKKDAEDQLSGDMYGPDAVFLALKGKCFDKDEGHYKYTICPFDSVKQGYTNMGRWKSWGEQTYGSWGGKHDFAKMIFEDGDRCWNGPARSTEVRVVCGADNVVLSVDEPSMCTYKMVFQTPAICE